MIGEVILKILRIIIKTVFVIVLLFLVYLNFEYIRENIDKIKDFSLEKIPFARLLNLQLSSQFSSVIQVKNDTFSDDSSLHDQYEEDIRLVIVGDIMLDRRVRKDIKENGYDYVFGGVKDFLIDADIVVGNLEGPITDNDSITIDFNNKSLRFTFDKEVASRLKEYGFDVFGLGNNHLLDFGQEGYEKTIEYLDNAGIQYYGHPNNNQNISTVVTSNGVAIGLVGYHQFSFANKNIVIDEIKRLKDFVDILIVTPHWGEEYDKEPSQYIKGLAKDFKEAGADIVVGTHQHVLQGSENIDGVPVIYSLGNFVFDQDFSKETRLGMALILNIKIDKDPLNKDSIKPIKIVEIDITGLPVSIKQSKISISIENEDIMAVDKILNGILTK